MSEIWMYIEKVHTLFSSYYLSDTSFIALVYCKYHILEFVLHLVPEINWSSEHKKSTFLKEKNIIFMFTGLIYIHACFYLL